MSNNNRASAVTSRSNTRNGSKVFSLFNWLVPSVIVATYVGVLVAGTRIGHVGGFYAVDVTPLTTYQHGWPLPFLTRASSDGSVNLPWRIDRGRHIWSYKGIIVDLALFAIVSLGLFTYVGYRDRLGFGNKLTLREMLVTVTILGIIFSDLASRNARGNYAAHIRKQFEELGCTVGVEYSGPLWWSRISGDLLSESVGGLNLWHIREVKVINVEGDVLEKLCKLCDKISVETVIIEVDWSDEQVSTLASHLVSHETRHMSFAGSNVSRKTVDVLLASESLEELDLSGTQVGDDELAEICKLERLHRIDLRDTNVSGDGVRKLLAARSDIEIRWE